MKKTILIFTILLVFLLNIITINASISVNHRCEDYRCTEGTDITYHINIRNNIDKNIVVNYIKVKDELDKNIAVDTESKYALKPNESNLFNITEKIPLPPRGGYTLDYYACFGVTVLYAGGHTEVNEVCGEVKKSLTVLPLGKIQCEENKDCEADEYCDVDFFKCKEVKCDGFVTNHKCVNKYVVIVPVMIILMIFASIVIKKLKKVKKLKEKKS